jgi:hypothetical protein
VNFYAHSYPWYLWHFYGQPGAVGKKHLAIESLVVMPMFTPPMSTQLEQAGIELIQGFDPIHLKPAPDLVIIGNAMSRGNPSVEYVLDQGIAYTSGPQWLHDFVLPNKWVLAVAGTHGKNHNIFNAGVDFGIRRDETRIF